jgi:hypothetical protein
MVTLGVALILGELANKLGWLTGGADGLQGVMMGPVLGLFEFDIFGKTAYLYSLAVLFVLFLLARRIVSSPFGLSLRAIRDNPLRAIGDRACRCTGGWSRSTRWRPPMPERRRAARPDHAIRLARRARLPPLGRR